MVSRLSILCIVAHERAPTCIKPDGGDHDGSGTSHGCEHSGASHPVESHDIARVGVVACVMFMAGGLYWTASVGLLTVSALTAYPVMVMLGMGFSSWYLERRIGPFGNRWPHPHLIRRQRSRWSVRHIRTIR